MPLLKYQIENHILKIVLSDPQTHNAFSPAMAAELSVALACENYHAVVLTAEGSVFCSGGNLNFYKNLKTKEEGLVHNRRITEILDQFHQLSVPKACFVGGPCYGGGVEVLSCFDHVVATPDSLFGLWQRRIGLTFGWGGQERLSRRLNPASLEAWLISAQTISVYEARKLGLVDKILLSAKGLESCLHWVENSLSRGEENLRLILGSRNDQPSVFSQLWLSERHRQVLKKYR